MATWGLTAHSSIFAEKIHAADFLLVTTGAGFSADSGLPVYMYAMDIANVDAYSRMGVEYHDLCDPCWIHNDLPVFYGFWGDCFNMYRDTTPHGGYEILQRWKERVTSKDGAPTLDTESATTEPFFTYTSNVDAHFLKYFRANETFEIHGNTENWQCSDQSCEKIWQLPVDFRFTIDKDTMLAQETNNFAYVCDLTTFISHCRDTSSFLKCEDCGAPARPNVLMFGDGDWLENSNENERYNEWLAAVRYALQQDATKRLVILEIGCGTRVPTVRMHSEGVLLQVLKKTLHTYKETGHYQVELIRVNPVMEPDVYKWQSRSKDKMPSPMLKINGYGLATLRAIDDALALLDETA
ncbi:Aste57867_22019 [Aphanomyces stellatus]|uniref:Aste57867_22019 protein n=1 Tax=Aphanomyces stellatus TaxID=120398 RepID=A0A485LJ41_9STRA|nr:hypothetical protein As57867_021950 [Aphanomyces stellatus]VFT98687.1 Aste57867_22019 [Aphanomyces stellatus]